MVKAIIAEKRILTDAERSRNLENLIKDLFPEILQPYMLSDFMEMSREPEPIPELPSIMLKFLQRRIPDLVYTVGEKGTSIYFDIPVRISDAGGIRLVSSKTMLTITGFFIDPVKEKTYYRSDPWNVFYPRSYDLGYTFVFLQNFMGFKNPYYYIPETNLQKNSIYDFLNKIETLEETFNSLAIDYYDFPDRRIVPIKYPELNFSDAVLEKINSLILGKITNPWVGDSEIEYPLSIVAIAQLYYFDVAYNFFRNDYEPLADLRTKYLHNLEKSAEFKQSQLKAQILHTISMNKFLKPYHTLKASEKEVIDRIYEARKTPEYPYSGLLAKLSDYDRKTRESALSRIRYLEGKAGMSDEFLKYICKHVAFMLNSKLGEFYLMRQIVSEFSTNFILHGWHICKFCGQEIGQDSEEVFDKNLRGMVRFDEDPDDIKQQIRLFVYWDIDRYFLINDASLVRSPHINNWLNQVFEEINQYIVDIDKKLRRIKTNNKEDVMKKIRYYTSVHVFALMIKTSASENIKFKPKYVPVSKAPGILETSATAVKLLLKIYSDLGISIEFIKKDFLYAYSRLKVQTLSGPPEILYYLVNDPVYFWIARVYNKSPAMVSEILGKPIEELDAQIYDKVGLLAEKSIYDKAFNLMILLMCGKDVDNKLVDLKAKVEESADYLRYFRKSLSFSINQNNGRRFKMIPADLSKIYGPDGKKLVWDKFIVQVGKSTREYKKSEIVDLIGKPEYYNMQVIDKISTTGIVLSKTDQKSVIDRLNLNSDLETFYNIYQFQCPETGKLHEYENMHCINCEINSEILKTKADDYFYKYKKIYDSRLKPTVIPIETFSDAPPISKVFNLPEKFNETLHFLGIIAGVSSNLIYNIGLSENYDWNEISNKIQNPSENAENINSARVNRLADYLNLIKVWVNLVRNPSKRVYLPYELGKLSIAEFKIELPEINIPRESYGASQYLLFNLANLIVKISEVNKEFAKICIEKVLEMDRNFSKYSIALLKEGYESMESSSEEYQNYESNYDDYGDLDFEDDLNDNLEGNLD